jgi:hypothetical protein
MIIIRKYDHPLKKVKGPKSFFSPDTIFQEKEGKRQNV